MLALALSIALSAPLGAAASDATPPTPHAGAPAELAAATSSVRPAAAGRGRGYVVSLSDFTIEGAGLGSSAEEVRRALGPPEEESLISGPVEEEKSAGEAGEEGEDAPLETRPPEMQHDRVVYSYFTKGVQVIFDEKDMRPSSIEIFMAEKAPYGAFTGSFREPLPRDVREEQMLRPLAKQIYKDAKNALWLKKDDRAPRRETAALAFTDEGWLSRITFAWEENYMIDLDDFCVADVCLGDTKQEVLSRLGPPDRYGVRRDAYTGKWDREGIRVSGRRSGDKEEVTRINISIAAFDGGTVQSLPLTRRKQFFHDYLGDRIYQESRKMICAYRKGVPRSEEKMILLFDDDERLETARFIIAKNVEIDFAAMSAAGLRVGEPAAEVKRLLGGFKKWRELERSYVLGYPRYGMRVFVAKSGKTQEAAGRGNKGVIRKGDLGAVEMIEIPIAACSGLCSVPISLADTMKAYEKKGEGRVFRKKGNTLYLSPDGEPPPAGVAALVTFEKTGWPETVVFKKFREITVDLKNFTVSGVGIGTHADEMLRVLGRPARAREIKRDNLGVYRYPDRGITMVTDLLNRSVCKITIDMERFEGSFAQEVTVDSNADDFEKAVHAQIYKQDNRVLWLTRDGREPTWDEGAIYIGFTGDVETIVFQTLAVKKEGILLDITKELQ